MCGHNLIHILITSLTLVSLVSSELYHIVPTDSPSLCVNYTADSCMSLAQFAGRYVTSNDSSLTLVFSPGEHTLSQIIHISNIRNVTLIGDSEQLTVINYVGDSGFELVNISSVLFIANLNIRRGGQSVLSIHSAGTVFIDKCQIVGTNFSEVSQLTAVNIYSALEVTVSESKFENNQIRYNLSETYINGSALFISTSHSVLVKESTFTNNSVSALNTAQAVGAAICLMETNVATLINCTVNNNTIRLCHGCRDVTGLGGAVYLHQVNHQFTVINSTFEKNEIFASASAGGAIFVNTSKSHGTIRITGSTFLNNSAIIGGSVFVYGLSSFIFQSSNNVYTGNTAFHQGGAIAIPLGHIVEIHGDYYIGNTALRDGAAVMAKVDTFKIFNSSCIENTSGRQDIPSGGTINLRINDNGSCNISRNSFTGNKARMGGAIATLVGTNSTCHSSLNTFVSNSALFEGGAVFLSISGGNATFDSSHNQYIWNVARTKGGATSVQVFDGEYISSHNVFQDNIARLDRGGAVALLFKGTGWSSSFHNWFADNAAMRGGAVHIETINKISHFQTATDSIFNNTFRNNRANIGGALNVFKRKLRIVKTYFSNNWVDNGVSVDSVLCARNAEVMVSNCTVSETGSIILINAHFFAIDFRIHKITGSLISSNSVLEFDGKCEFVENTCTDDGGAISATRSDIQFRSTATVEIRGNRAKNGGGIFLFESQLNISCPINITGNTATQSGGGIYAYRSDISFTHENTATTIDNNIAQRNGGGAALVSSTLNVYKGIVIFHNNTAHQGGGAVYLEQRSTLSVYVMSITEMDNSVIVSPAKLVVQENSAQYGGGVFVDDYTSGHTLCEHVNNLHTSRILECFIQGLGGVPYRNIILENIIFWGFVKNKAQEEGSDIYGGLLDRCTINPDSYMLTLSENVTSLNYIRQMSDFDNENGLKLTNTELAQHITSLPVQMCFCIDNKTVDCTTMQKDLSVRRGGTFRLMVTAVDQVHNQVTGTIIAAFSNNVNTGHFNEGQTKRSINNSCTELEYNVYSDRPEVLIDLYADGPCGDEGLSKRTLSVTFLPCTCPIGFQPSEANQNCTCSCDTEIKTIANCSGDVITLLSHDWVGFVNESTNNTGLLVHLCPFDYCLERPVNISLSVPNGADMQCAFNRSNLLCGECKQGLSLALGSSKCMKCTGKHLALLLPFAILGILLVALILILNMTVAVGTINGLIFYANIVGAAQSVFFSGKEVLPLKIFIAWLNLDFGIETCFYNGMTSTAKVLLQLVFPSYLILLTVVIIVLCECSQKFAALLGKRNPVATLCTLILLSYSKLLRMIIASLQFTYLSYPDHSSHIVWLYDANVPYFEPSHLVPLFLVSSIIIILGAVYTVLLFFGQWLPQLANKKMMKWIRHPKYNAFIDAYHAPFSPKRRYWVGLLLLARIVHDLVQALTADRSVTLLTTACVALTLVMLKMMNVHTHKNWTIDTLESFFLVQLVVLSLGTYHVGESHGSQMALVTTSTSASFLIFIAITCYHFYKYVLHNTRVWMAVERVFSRKRYRGYQLVAVVDNDSSDEEEFERASLREEPHNYTEDAHTDSQEGQANPPLYDPPVIQSALILDQLREPALDILDPVTADHYREAIRRRQPNPPPREPTAQFINRPTH